MQELGTFLAPQNRTQGRCVLYSPGAVDKKTQENSWRYIDQRSEIVKRVYETRISYVSCHTAIVTLKYTCGCQFGLV